MRSRSVAWALAMRSAAGRALAAHVGDGHPEPPPGSAARPRRRRRRAAPRSARPRRPRTRARRGRRATAGGAGRPGRRSPGAGRGAGGGRTSTWARTVARSRALSHGFSTKSVTPLRMVSTASGDRRPRGHHHDGQRGIEGAHAGHQLQPFAARRSCRGRSSGPSPAGRSAARAVGEGGEDVRPATRPSAPRSRGASGAGGAPPARPAGRPRPARGRRWRRRARRGARPWRGVRHVTPGARPWDRRGWRGGRARSRRGGWPRAGCAVATA